jgi:Mg2+/Co2+ transporter CorB
MEHGEKPAIGTMLRVADADISILSMEDELIKKVKITKTKKG